MIQSFFYCCVRLGLPFLFFSRVNAKIYVSFNIHGIMALKILLLSMQNQMNLFQNTYEQDIFTNQACFIWLISQWNPLSCTSHHCHTYVEMDNIFSWTFFLRLQATHFIFHVLLCCKFNEAFNKCLHWPGSVAEIVSFLLCEQHGASGLKWGTACSAQ